ncbi:MAG: Ig-like domain-containing protein [Planctomycetota bacterium]|nr:Ig-like domain-containing protein [Planctomycetota bacterium]
MMTALIFSAGSMGYLAADEEATKTGGSWDPVSREVIPKIMEKNGDTASIVRYVSAISCRIDLEITSSTFPGTAQGVLSYRWKDADNNGILSPNEIDIETEYVSMEGMGLVMGEFRRALENETTQNTFNVFKSHNVTTVKTDEGYKMKLKPKSAELVKRLGYSVLYVTIANDFRITKLRAKDDSGGEANIELKHQKAGDIWLIAGSSKRTDSGDGATTEEARTNVYAEVNGIPVISQIAIDTAVSTAMGAVTVRQVCTFRDWEVVKRDKPLSVLTGGFDKDEEAFKNPTKPDKPKTTKDPDEELFGDDKPKEQPESTKKGSSFEDALVVKTIDAEYEYIAGQKCDCGGAFDVKKQELKSKDDKMFDILNAVCRNCGAKRAFYFDITERFKGAMGNRDEGAAKPTAPNVASTEPGNAAGDVPVDVGKIAIKFDRDMNRDSYSICPADDGEFPPVEGGASFADARTFVIKLGKLEPGKTYALSLNSESKKGFRSAGDIELPLKPFILKFTTAK